MAQLLLQFDRLAGLGACAFGPGDPAWEGPHHCPACAAYVQNARRQFAAAVARGQFDPEGYTRAERTAQQRRRAA